MYSVAFNWGWQNFAANGYAVLFTNPRGSTGYGQDFVNGIQFSYPGKDYDDLMAGVDAALSRGFIDDKKPLRLRRQRGRGAYGLDRRAHEPIPGRGLDAAGHQLAFVRRDHGRAELVSAVPEIPVGRSRGIRRSLAFALCRECHDADHGHDRRGRPPDARSDRARNSIAP